MAHAAAPRSENILKQGYLKKSINSPDFLISASKQFAINLKQKFEPSRWYVFGTRNGQPYLEYFDREERVFTGHPTDTIDLSSFRNLSYTMGRTNNKHAFCIFLGNRVVELMAPNRPQMLDWCRCLERNLRQLGFKNQTQREDHLYSDFPVNDYKPTRSGSLTDDEPPVMQTGATGSQVAENPYEDVVNTLTCAKTIDDDEDIPSVPPRPPKAHHSQDEEEVFASLESVTRASNPSDGVYYMFDYSDDRRVMEAFVSASESDVDNSDLADYDDVNAVVPDKGANKKSQCHSDEDDDDDGERCTSLPIMPCLPAKPPESDTSEDSDFVSTSFWLRNRKEGRDLISFDDDDKTGTVKLAQNRDLPPVPLRSDLTAAPPLPTKTDSSNLFRSRQCTSMYVKPKSTITNKVPPGVSASPKALRISDGSRVKLNTDPPPLPKRPDDVRKEFEKQKQVLILDSEETPEKTKVSLGKRFDSIHVCLDPLENADIDGDYESLKVTKREPNNNIHFEESNAVENSIYGEVWSSGSTDKSKPNKLSCTQCKMPENGQSNDLTSVKPSVSLHRGWEPESCEANRNSSEVGSNCSSSDHENFYTDFPTLPISQKSTSNESNTKLKKSAESAMPKCDTSPVLPKRKNVPLSDFSTDLKQVHAHGDSSNSSKLSHSEHSSIFGASSDDIPVAPPRRNRKTVAAHGPALEKQMNASRKLENKSGLHSPPLPKKPHGISQRKMSEDMIDIPLALPPRKSMIKSQSVDESSPRNAGVRPRSHISSRQKSVPHSGAVAVMNLKQNQVDILRSEIAMNGGMVRTISTEHFKSGLALVECFEKVWIAGWDVKKYPRLYDKFHIGDQVLSVNDVEVTDLSFTHKIVKHIKADLVEVTIRRLPNASAFAIQRSVEGENLGIKREGGTGEIVYTDPHGLAYRQGLTNKAPTMDGLGTCNWYLTEINNRPLNLFFKDNEIQHRLLAVGRDISIVVQPSDFILELKRQLKKLRGYKDYLVQ